MNKYLSIKFNLVLTVIFTSLIASTSMARDSIQTVSFTTEDNIIIKASLAKPKSISGKLPAVIFIHQGGSDKSEWTSLPIFKDVVNNQMIALAFDVRGHGDSAGHADFSTIFNDPKQAPKDLQAAIKYLLDSNLVDKERIAVVGASIGANLASMAAGSKDFHIKTAVALSGKTSAVYNLAGIDKSEMNFKSLFLIAAELEQGGKRAFWAKEIYDLTQGAKQLEIVKGSSQHGVSVFKDAPELQKRIMKWLQTTLVD